MKKPKRPKAVSYVLIPQTSDIGRPMYEQLYAIVEDHHPDLAKTNVRIALAWATSWKSDVDGRITLGKCKKATELDRELAPFDFVILLNREYWQNPRFTDLQRTALLDHELMHAAVAFDEDGDPKVDGNGRTMYRIRKHDLEEFADIAARYGCWKRDLEAFAQALSAADSKKNPSAWVGYSSLRDTLAGLNIDVPTTIIATWSDDERREVLSWALLKTESDKIPGVTLISMPGCLAAAVQPTMAETSH